LQLLRNRNFASLWFGQGLSQLGDAVHEVTLPVWVGLLTGSAGHVATVAAAQMLPALIAGPVAGVFADRWNARATMLVCDLLRALLIGLLLLVPQAAVLPAIYAAGFGIALIGLVFNPSKNVALRAIVSPDDMTQAQALTRAMESVALLLGPVLGSGLLLMFGPAAGLVFDALTFISGALSVLRIHLPPQTGRQGDRTVRLRLRVVLAELGAGVDTVIRNGELVTLLVIYAVVYLVGSLWFAVDMFFVQQTLGMPKESVGLLWTASGAGGLAGSAVVVAVGRRVRQRTVLLAGLGMRSVAVVWYASMTSYVWALTAAALAGLGGALISVAVGSIMVAHAPQRSVGRVTALFDTAGQLSGVLALLAVSTVVHVVTPAETLLICGLALSLAWGGATLQFRLRDVPPANPSDE
jgi:MFS family permease